MSYCRHVWCLYLVFILVWLLCTSTRPDWQVEVLRSAIVRLSVHPFVCYQTCEPDILNTNEVQIGADGARSKGMNGQLCGAAGQQSKPHETKDRFGGLTFALFSTRLGWVAFLDPLTFCLALPVLPPTTYYSSPHSALGGLAPSVFWLEPPLNVERSSLWA